MPGNFYALQPADIAAWPPPQYNNPEDTRDYLPAFAIAWQAVATVLAAGRFYLRASGKAGAWGYDDGLILFAWIFSIGLTVVACLEGWNYDVNRHTWDVLPQNYVPAALCGWLAQLCFLFSTFGIKLSVLLFYRRMVKDSVSRAWMYTIWTFIFITVAAYVGAFVTFMTICQPLEAYWLAYQFNPPYTVEWHCIDGQAFDLAVSVLLGASDIWSVVIPCLMLRHYQLDVTFRQKLALNFIFCLGLLATGAGIARSYYLWQIDHTSDIFRQGFYLYIWSLVECHLGIICACLPSLRAFFRYYFGDPARRTNTSGARSAGRSVDGSVVRDSRRWSKRNTKDSWHTEMATIKTQAHHDRPMSPSDPHSPMDSLHSPHTPFYPTEKSAEISLYPKHSVEDMG